MPPQQEQRGVKRKPPTFQHLPVERAKKLKRSWVEAQKIKSKWKAQKRKEGLVAPRPQLEDMVDAPEDKGEGSDDEEDEEAMSRHSDADPTSEESEDGVSEESEEESADELPSRPPPKHTRQTTAKGRTGRPQDKPEDKPTLRELQSRAYSKASLHHHKSLPLHRHKGPAVTRGRGGARGGNNRGAPRGRGRGRGQPDMGLRMKAMLEKIKQDMT